MKRVKLNFQEEVKNFMSKNSCTVKSEGKVRQAIDIMTLNKVGSVIVVDENFKQTF